MKRKNIISLIGASSLVVALALFGIPQNSDGNGINQQFVSTTCIGANTSYPCNDCTSGSNTCFDHTCSQCAPPPPMQ
jgi:hypothetical protein